MLKHSDYKLRIIGEGILKEVLINSSRENNVELELSSNLEHSLLLETYSEYLFYIQLSKFEGNPKTILEAMGAGCIVITTDVYGIGNIINNEEREVFKYELGCRLHTFSKSLLSEGEYSAARTQANSALTILKKIRKTEPSNINYQLKTSEIYRMLIDLHKEAGDHKKAIEYSREALTLAEILLEKDRDVEKNNKRKTNNQLKLGRDHGVFGYNLISLKDDDEAML